MSVRVQTVDFDIGQEIAALTKGRCDGGAISSFIGTVRDVPLVLEHYPGMTERALKDIHHQALTRFDLLGARLIHRTGALNPGDQIVLALALARHRQAALEATSFMMDQLKTVAPFWKLEAGKWVTPRTRDQEAAKTWYSDKVEQ